MLVRVWYALEKNNSAADCDYDDDVSTEQNRKVVLQLRSDKVLCHHHAKLKKTVHKQDAITITGRDTNSGTNVNSMGHHVIHIVEIRTTN